MARGRDGMREGIVNTTGIADTAIDATPARRKAWAKPRVIPSTLRQTEHGLAYGVPDSLDAGYYYS